MNNDFAYLSRAGFMYVIERFTVSDKVNSYRWEHEDGSEKWKVNVYVQ